MWVTLTLPYSYCPFASATQPDKPTSGTRRQCHPTPLTLLDVVNDYVSRFLDTPKST